MLTATQTKNNNAAAQIMTLFATMPLIEQSRLIDSLSTEHKRAASLRSRFKELYEQWWSETCVYSGRNLAMNTTYYKIIELGPEVLDYINELSITEPDYKLGHINWLRIGIRQNQK